MATDSTIIFSKQLYTVCKQCENPGFNSDGIIKMIATLIEALKIEQLNVNYQTPSGDYLMKYLFKSCRWKVFQFIVDQFREQQQIDLYITDNLILKNNVLHYMVQEMEVSNINDAMKFLDIMYSDKNVPILQPYSLLYQYNDYQDTPITYCRKRKLHKVADKLERLKYAHFHGLLIDECKVPYEIAHSLVEYLFIVVSADDLVKMQLCSRWKPRDVLISPTKQNVHQQ